MKKFYLYTIFLLFLFNNSFACQLLNVPIGSNINTAAQTFEFVDTYEEGAYEEEASVVFFDYAEDFCQGSNLKDTELEVIIYKSKLAGINLVNLDQNNKNLVYQFTKDFISDPGADARSEKWIGHRNLSVGNLLIFYGKVKHGSEIHEFLEISNPEMIDFTFGENLVGSEGQI